LAPKGSLPCTQEPVTGPYPEPDESLLIPNDNTIKCLSVFLVLCGVSHR